MNLETLATLKLAVETLGIMAILFKGSKWFGMVDARLEAIDASINTITSKVDHHAEEISHMKGQLGLQEYSNQEDNQ